MGISMHVIGITGGVGSGKTEILHIIEKHCNCRILYGDEIAHQVKEPGGVCYSELVSLLGKDVLNEDGSIKKNKMAEMIFQNDNLLIKVNQLIHPAVKKVIQGIIEEENKQGKLSWLFIEAALLIEDGYDAICDELWYIHTDEEIRRERLKTSRHYSDEKITDIMKKQKKKEEFEKFCSFIIENNGSIEETKKQIITKLEEA